MYKRQDLAYRKKQMFTVPVGEWFKTNRTQYCKNGLPFEWFNHQILDEIFNNHVLNNIDMTRELRALIAFKKWKSVDFIHHAN